MFAKICIRFNQMQSKDNSRYYRTKMELNNKVSSFSVSKESILPIKSSLSRFFGIRFAVVVEAYFACGFSFFCSAAFFADDRESGRQFNFMN